MNFHQINPVSIEGKQWKIQTRKIRYIFLCCGYYMRKNVMISITNQSNSMHHKRIAKIKNFTIESAIFFFGNKLISLPPFTAYIISFFFPFNKNPSKFSFYSFNLMVWWSHFCKYFCNIQQIFLCLFFRFFFISKSSVWFNWQTFKLNDAHFSIHLLQLVSNKSFGATSTKVTMKLNWKKKEKESHEE